MALIRNMGAGLAGSSAYGVNVSGNFGGGSKKQGLAPVTNKPSNFIIRTIIIRASSNSKKVVIINQLGGIGRLRSQFVPTADGVHFPRRVMVVRPRTRVLMVIR